MSFNLHLFTYYMVLGRRRRGGYYILYYYVRRAQNVVRKPIECVCKK